MDQWIRVFLRAETEMEKVELRTVDQHYSALQNEACRIYDIIYVQGQACKRMALNILLNEC